MKNKNKLLVFIITYNSSFRLKTILSNLKKLKNKVRFVTLISDDCSTDDTPSFIPKKKKSMIVNINKRNIGYGGNIKKCLYYAIKNNFSHAVMIHGDNQYDVRYIPALYKKIKKTKVDAVTGSRMIKLKDALSGKMPIYKLIGNFVLTNIFNFVYQSKFTDAHSGLWIYKISSIKDINFKKFDDNYNFDNQLRIKFINSKKKILEIPIKTYYRNEKSSFHVIYTVKFLMDVFKKFIK